MLTLSTMALYHGPNPFSEDPVLVSRLACAEGEWYRYRAAITRLSEASSDWYLPQHGRAQLAELALFESLAETLGITMLGADYITTDISCSPREIAGGVVEINTCPGLDAMIAAGWPTERAGALVLPRDIGAVPKTLVIVSADRLDRLVCAAQTARWPVGAGWASRGEAAVSGAASRVPEGQGWIGVQMLLGHRAVAHAILFASDREILRLGMPVAQVDHLVLAASLPAAWQLLLSLRTSVGEFPGPIAEPEDLIQGLMGQLAEHDLFAEGGLK